jgi:transketolase
MSTTTVTPYAQRPTSDCRDAWVEALLEIAAEDPRVVAVVNDSVGSSKLGPFQAQFADRLVNVGIAEQDMVGVGAGLANGGKIPFVSAAACFLTARAMEQVKVDAAYSAHHLVLVGQSPGMAYGELGPTHHSIEDLGWLRTIPGLTVIVPADPEETRQAIRWAHRHDGPVYVRVSRMGVPDVNPEGYEFVPGRAVTLREGEDVTLIATGTVVGRTLDAAELLAAQGVRARVLSMPTVKPLDTDAVVAAAASTARCRCGSWVSRTPSRPPGRPNGCSTTSGSRPRGSPARRSRPAPSGCAPEAGMGAPPGGKRRAVHPAQGLCTLSRMHYHKGRRQARRHQPGIVTLSRQNPGSTDFLARRTTCEAQRMWGLGFFIA